MRVDFLHLPNGSAGIRRPMINVVLEDLPTGITCLVDTGAFENRFSAELAQALGLEPEPDAEWTEFWAGGLKYRGWMAKVQLTVRGDGDEFAWEAPVCFAVDWTADFQLLGVQGFFRWFKVCFHTAYDYLDLEFADR